MAVKTYFYILMLLFFLSLLGGAFMTYGPYTHAIGSVGSLVEFLLFALIGYKLFGPAVQG
jgi:hypothetical protein